MPKIAYITKRFSQSCVSIINHANEIIDEYEQMGFSLTLRQLYYQFVSRALIENNLKEYKRLGSVINDARLAGLIDWFAIEDRTRSLRGLGHWESPSQIVAACAEQFKIDKWENQKFHIEVWIEKDALVGVIERVCNENDVSYFSCRGYTSQSEMWSAAQRLRARKRAGKSCIVLHLGDHDPSGVDMTRDIRDRFDLFQADCLVSRIALTYEQVREYNPPPNFVKATDSRSGGYRAEFGEDCWELDALEPQVIERLIRENIEKYRSEQFWLDSLELEEQYRKQLREIADTID